MEPKVPTTITLSPTTVSLTAIGQAQQLSATVTDQDGATITSPGLTWSSTNTAVAAVTPAGLVSAIKNGSAEISATAGAASASATVTVVQTPAQIQKVSGDRQTAAPGQAVSLPLTVQVNDANGVPIAGVTVTFTAAAGVGTVGTPSGATGADGRRSTSFIVLSAGSLQVTAAVVGTSLVTSFTQTGVSPFAVELRFLTTTTPAQMQAFLAAQQRWQALIVGDLTDVSLDAAAGTCGSNSPSIQRPIDDVLILVTLEPIDGPGNILGAAGPCYIRIAGSLSVMGLMRFDTADLDLIESAGLLQQVILHEMGHVLGYGTLWPELGLLADPSLSGGADPHFTGTQATAAFDAAGGTSYAGGLKVPVENTGGAATADAHWRESVFGSELMTGFIQVGENPLSQVSVASMADLGYAVNATGADPYTLAPALRAFGIRRALELKNDVVRLPIRVVNEAGDVVRIVEP